MMPQQGILRTATELAVAIFLIQATSVVGAAGAVGAAWPFVSYWSPSEKAKALGAPVKIDLSKLAPGEMLAQSSRGVVSRYLSCAAMPTPLHP